MDDFSATKSTLIELVREKECLWNQKARVYHTTTPSLKKKAWVEIGKVLNVDGEVSQAMWKTLRSQYVRETKKANKRSGSAGGVYCGTWPFFYSLSFLKDVVTPRSTSGNMDSESQSLDNRAESTPRENPNGGASSTPQFGGSRMKQPEEPSVGNNEDFIEDLGLDHIDEADPMIDVVKDVTSNDTPNVLSSGEGGRKRHKSASARALEIQEKKLKLFEDRLAERKKDMELGNDPDSLFLKSLLPELKKVRDSFGLKMKIMETIKDFQSSEEFIYCFNDSEP